MKHLVVLCIGLLLLAQTAKSQISYTWKGTVSTDWNTAGNWNPAGIPGAADNVTIVTGSNTCLMPAAISINNFTLTSGTLDMGGNTLTVNGTAAIFTAGTVQNGTFTVTGAANTSFNNGPTTMNCTVNITSAAVSIKNTTFQNAVTVTKTGPSNDNGAGGNTFNGTFTVTNTGAGYFLMGNGNADHFNAAATFNNTGTSNIYVNYNNVGSVFNGPVAFNNSPSNNSLMYVNWYSTGTVFNDNITITSTSGPGISFCGGNASAAVSLVAGKTITVGGAGWSSGNLSLRGFNQLGSTAQNITMTGTGGMIFGPGSTFNGDVTSSSPAIYLNGSTFNGAATITKTGGTGDYSIGGNTFNGLTTLNSSGASFFLLGNSNPDIFNNDLILNDNGSERLLLAWNSVGNMFNGNITANTSGSAQGIEFCGGSGTATAILAAGKTIQPGATGLTAGYLYLKQFTQLGAAPINLSGTGTSVVYLGPSSSFGGTVTVTAPDIWAQGATYASAASFTKTGGTNNHNNTNQNIFNSTCSITQLSNTGYFMLGYSSNDLFNDNITITCTGSGGVYLGWTSGTGTPTLAAGKTIQVGAGGFSAGFLYLNTFTQLGNAPMNLSFTGSNTQLIFARGSAIGGDLTASVPDIYFNGCTFGGIVNATKFGNNNDNSSGSNTFNGAVTLNNLGKGYIQLGNSTPDIFNSDATFNTSSQSYIGPAWNSAGNMFNGNIIVSSTSTATGIQFCAGGTATATQAAGKSISIGAAGFTNGSLVLQRFTQLGNTATNLTLTGSTTVAQMGPSSAFGGDFTVTSPRILLQGATFSGNATFTKNGATGEWSFGGNTFNGTTTINQQGAGYFGFANGAPDIYNGDVYANNNSIERIIFGNTPTGNQFNGNIILTEIGSSQGIAFGWNSTTNETQAAGKTISIGAAGFSVGFLQIERFTQLGNTPMNLTLTGSASLTFGPTSTIGGDLTATSPTLFFNGCTFNGAVTATKNGPTNDNSNGGNIFNGTTTMTNSGTGQLLLGNGNPDQFLGATTFNNTGTNNIQVAYNSTGNIFGGPTTFNNTPTTTSGIYVSPNSAGTVFNDNIIVTSTFGQGVQFCGGNGTATVSMAANKTISIGPGGFSSGTLLLKQFTQAGPSAESFTLTGTGILTYGPLSSFGSDVTSSSPTIYLNGCTFNGVTNITKTGSTGDYSNGGNVFNGVTTLTNSGTSYFLLGNVNPDIWNNDVTFTDNGSERLLPCWATTGNQFNGNIYVNTANSAQGIQFCGGNATATATQAAGKSILTGATGLSAGYLQLRQFTQLGNAPINITMATTATYLQFGPSSTMGGDVTSTSPGLYFQGCTFNGAVTSTKTGSSNDQSAGSNTFNGVAILNATGAGYLMLGNGNHDQFNSTATFNNMGSANMYIAHNSAGNVFGGLTTFNNTPTANTAIYVSQNSAGTLFNDNIVVTSSNGQGVQFCGAATATATLAATKNISIGPGGFSAGTLLLRQFTQLGSAGINLTLTGTGNLTFGPSSAIGGNMTSVSPTLFFNGCIFGGTVTAQKNGLTSDGSIGNNTFGGAFVITNTGTGNFIMGNGNPDTWNSTATFNNQSPAQHMYVAFNSTGNTFNGDVLFNNQPGATGIWIFANNSGINTRFNGNISVQNVNGAGVYFGNGTGTAALTGSISVGAAGFNFGTLILKNFTQTGAAVQNITTTGSSTIQFGPSSAFGGTVTTSSPGLLFNGCTFTGTVSSTKTGFSNDQSSGNNTFSGATTLTNTGSGYLMMTNTTPDTYNGNMTFVRSGAGQVYPNYNGNSTYAGNVTVTATAGLTFGSGTGTATFNGSGAQSISVTAGTPAPVFTRLVIANTGAAGVTLTNTNISVSSTLTMSSGLLNTTATYMLTMLNNSTTAAGTALSTSFVNGPMAYQKSTAGATVLNFPIGNGPDCRPIVLTVNHSNGTLYTYTATLFDASAHGLNYTFPPTVDKVSGVHYYTVVRTNGAGAVVPATNLVGNQQIQIFFGANDIVTDGTQLTVIKNTFASPTAWIDIGGMGGPAASGGADLTGSITSTSAPSAFTSFSTFALGDKIGGGNVLPIGVLNFDAVADNNRVDLTWTTATESNNSYFTVERSRDGSAFEEVARVKTQAVGGNSNVSLDYTAQDNNPYSGTSYYRLKQTDLDGNSTYSRVIPVSFDRAVNVSIYPNPTRGTVYVGGLDQSETNLKVEWYDVSGRLLSTEVVPVNGGLAALNPHFNNGVYMMRFMAGGKFRMQSIMIMK